MKSHIFERRVRGHLVLAELLEGSWKYPSSGIGLRIASSIGSEALLYDNTLSYARSTIPQVQNLLQSIEIERCSNDYCKHMAFNPLTVTTDRDGLCESCYQQNEAIQKTLYTLNTLKNDLSEVSLAVDRGDNFVVSFASIPSLTGNRQVNVYLKKNPNEEELSEILNNLGQTKNADFTIINTPALLKEINFKISDCKERVA